MSTNLLPLHSTSSQVPAVCTNLEQVTDLMVKRARELVTRLIALRGREEPPFLAEELAPLQGVKEIEKTDLGDLDALIFRSAEGYVIKVNANHPPSRQNYSCAHEIGHTFLHELEQRPVGDEAELRALESSMSGRDKERLCQSAAAELLMPESIFKKYLSRFGVSVTSIEWLAHTFRVSIPATAIRIEKLSEEPCIALKWKPWHKARSKGFYLDWPRHLLRSKYVRNPSLLKAYESNSAVKSRKSFDIGHTSKLCYMESKGFGRGSTRYVISLLFPERQNKAKRS